jgi:hypothetical protein
LTGFIFLVKPHEQKNEEKAKHGEITALDSGEPVAPVGEMPRVSGSRPLKSEYCLVCLNDRWTVIGTCIFLAAITLVVFWRTFHYGFIFFDGDIYPVIEEFVEGFVESFLTT